MPKNDGVYECEAGYLHIYDFKAKCVSREYCIGNGTAIYEEKQTCVEYKNCMIYNGYFYRGESGSGKECVSAEECLKKGWHPYPDLGECLEIEPASDGDFIERADNIY